MQKVFYPTNLLLFCLLATLCAYADTKKVTLIYDEKPTQLNATVSDSKDLWITMKDLKLATHYVVKPQGVCRDELCFPLPKAQKSKFITKQGSVEWFNLSEFGRLIKEPMAFDEKNAVYYFGPRAESQNSHIESLDAPDFTLPDLQGKPHSLRDFRGKKVLLLTWASW